MHFLQPNDMEVAGDLDANKGGAGCANEIVHMRMFMNQPVLPVCLC